MSRTDKWLKSDEWDKVKVRKPIVRPTQLSTSSEDVLYVLSACSRRQVMATAREPGAQLLSWDGEHA